MLIPIDDNVLRRRGISKTFGNGFGLFHQPTKVRIEGIFPETWASRVQTKRLQSSGKVTCTTSRQEINQSVFETIRVCLETVIQRTDN